MNICVYPVTALSTSFVYTEKAFSTSFAYPVKVLSTNVAYSVATLSTSFAYPVFDWKQLNVKQNINKCLIVKFSRLSD